MQTAILKGCLKSAKEVTIVQAVNKPKEKQVLLKRTTIPRLHYKRDNSINRSRKGASYLRVANSNN